MPRRHAHPRFGPPSFNDGSKVTIGIAARTNNDDCIVTVSDRRISFDDVVPSLDSAFNKNWFIGHNWGTLCAANDTCFALPIIDLANDLLKARGGSEGVEDVKAAMCDAYAEIRQEYVTRQFLGKYGIKSIDQFRKEGASNLGRKLFWSLSRKLENERLEETIFLVYGYGKNLTAHLFEVKNPGTAFMLDHLRYSAIGSGTAIAMASLNLRPTEHLQPAQLAYRVLEAKFAAENSSAVGKSTSVLFANRGQATTFLTFRSIQRIRELWEQSRFNPPPDEINKIIKTIDLPIARP